MKNMLLVSRFAALFLILAIFLLSPIHLNALHPATKYYRPHDDIYHPNIRTVKLHRVGDALSLPVISLNSDDRLHLSFDDLNRDVTVYRYTVLHCDAFWNFSDLWPSDYISGFMDDLIQDYKFSFNTLQPYTHYKLILPNDNLRFNLSGNYLLIVFPSDDQENVAFTRRFSVLDGKVSIDAEVKIPTLSTERLQKQKVDFVINTQTFRIVDPYDEVKVIVRQNNRWDNELYLRPYQIQGEILDYKYLDETNNFYGTNEFRTLDLRTVKYATRNMQRIERTNDGYYAFMFPDESRATASYFAEGDLNGRFQILSQDAQFSEIGSEYVHVHFVLNMERPIPNGDVYVFGMHTDWQFRDDNRMIHDAASKSYQAVLYLKQGFYNYHYTFLPAGSTTANTGLIEGDFVNTGNEYTIYVYYRIPGTRHDSLIGFTIINSRDFL